MAHIPVNHPLRPMYRLAGFVAGAYLVVFGIIGFITTSGDSFTGHTDGNRVLGQSTNLLWSIISLVFGALVVLATAVGRNIDVEVDKYLGWTILVLGSYSLATIRTDANFFGHSISTVIVLYLVGLLLIAVSLYSKVAAPSKAGPSRQVREGRAA
jgi:purine-cytosine permease-like protein